jgi:hypothetical protein
MTVVAIDQQVDLSIQNCDDSLAPTKDSLTMDEEEKITKSANTNIESSPTSPPRLISMGPRTECARILRDRCPACFGGNTFGRSFDQ